MNRIFLRVILISFFVIMALPFFFFKKKVGPVAQGTVVSMHTVKADNFAPGQLQANFVKHGYQFGSITEHEYLEDARKILDAPTGSEVLEKVRENGDVERYNPNTHEFALMTKTGQIQTYFITDDFFWSRQ